MLVEGIAVVGKVGFSVELIYTVDVDGFKVEVIVVGATVVVVARKLNKFIKFIKLKKSNSLVVGGIVDLMVVLLIVVVVVGGKVLASIVASISGNSKS